MLRVLISLRAKMDGQAEMGLPGWGVSILEKPVAAQGAEFLALHASVAEPLWINCWFHLSLVFYPSPFLDLPSSLFSTFNHLAT